MILPPKKPINDPIKLYSFIQQIISSNSEEEIIHVDCTVCLPSPINISDLALN